MYIDAKLIQDNDPAYPKINDKMYTINVFMLQLNFITTIFIIYT